MTKLLGIDFGYGVVKVFGPSKTNRSFSAYHEFVTNSTLPQPFNGSTQRTAIKIGDRRWIVFGEYASMVSGSQSVSRITSYERFTDPNFLRYIQAAIALELTPGSHTINVVYGLPVKRTLDQSLTDGISSSLINNYEPHIFETPDGRYEVVIQDVTYLEQPLGTVWDMLLGGPDSATPMPSAFDMFLSEEGSRSVLVFDMGSETTDIAVLTNLVPTQNASFSIIGGVNALTARLSDILRSHNYPVYDLQTLRYILDTGFAPLRHLDREDNVQDLVQQAKGEIWQEIQSQVYSLLHNMSIYHKIVVTGGGGVYLYDILAETFGRHRTVLATAPVFANARGFYKFGVYNA